MDLGRLLGGAALLVTAGGLGVGAVVLASTGRLLPALAAFLEMLTAAGLLRLAAAPTWSSALGAGGVLVVRRLATRGLNGSARPVRPQARRRQAPRRQAPRPGAAGPGDLDSPP